MKRFGNLIIALCLAAATVSATARPVQAMDRDVKAVLTAGVYGLGAGTLLGLASLSLTQNARSIFIGSSLGLYLGLAVGLYYVYDRDNPENPLSPRRDSRGFDEWGPLGQTPAQEIPLIAYSVTVARF